MANDLLGNVWVVDTVGIVTTKPITLAAIGFYPAAQSDACVLNWWDEGNAVSGSDRALKNATITSTTTFTDSDTGGVLTGARYPAMSILKIIDGNGSTANHTYHLIETAGDNNAIVTGATLTNEANKSYHIVCYPHHAAFLGKQPNDTNEEFLWYPFPVPFRFRNLVLDSISTSAKVVLYLA